MKGLSYTEKINSFPIHITRKALDRFPFFNFENLLSYFPHIKSIDEFITSEKYLGGIMLEIISSESEHSSLVLFRKLVSVFESIKNDIKANSSKYKGTKDFELVKVKEAVIDKEIAVSEPKNGSQQERGLAMGGPESSIPLNLTDEDWYVYSEEYGTSEEKHLVSFIYNIKDKLQKVFKETYLIRNQKMLDLFSFKKGDRFEPDYILMLGDGKTKANYLQLFIEPKGKHLEEGDKWKEEFLLEIKQDGKVFNLFEDDKYSIFGLPFYNKNEEMDFKDKMEKIVNIKI